MALALFLAIGLSLWLTFHYGFDLVGRSKARLKALALANQKIEIIRNLAYEAVGVAGGIPAGSLLAQEQIDKQGTMFTVQTDIRYRDDPFDGTAPADSFPNDYKRAQISVSWPGQSEPVVLLTNVAPPGLESETSGGTIKVSVFDSFSQPVAGANVFVENNELNPPISAHYQTDNQGLLLLPAAPQAYNSYHVAVSKSGYSSSQTYAVGAVIRPGQVLQTPAKPPLTVLFGQLSEIGFIIDLLADKNIIFQDQTGLIMPGVSFLMQGAKILGQDSEGRDIVKYKQEFVADAQGQALIEQIESDSYQINVDGYDLAGSLMPQPVNVLPGQTVQTIITLAPDSSNSLLVTVRNEAQEILPGASVRLWQGIFDKTIVAGESGQAFFAGLSEINYQVQVDCSGYESYQGERLVQGDSQEEIILTGL